MAGDILGDAVIFGPAVLWQVEGAEHLVDPREMDREIDIERLALEPMVPVVETRGRDPVAEAIEIAPDIGVEQRRPDIDEEIGRAHVRTPVTNAHLVCRLLLEKKKHNTKSAIHTQILILDKIK